MSGAPRLAEQYAKDPDFLNFVVYASTTAAGEDEVLQHKKYGAEMAHITLHPDGTVNVRQTRSADALKQFVQSGLAGFTPAPSERLRKFLQRVQHKI
jgi:hypothetical protein